MKGEWIQRYMGASRNITLGAGVYFLNSSIDATVVSFPVVWNRIGISCRASDVTTGQAIDASFSLALGLNYKRDNPGLNSTRGLTNFFGSDKSSIDQMLHFRLDPQEALNMIYTVYLSSVTANSVSAQMSVWMGYLCPEDYLSPEAFAMNPT